MAGWWMDPEVMKAVGFWGSGAATVIGGLWVAYKHVTSKGPAPAKPEPTIRADGGIATDGNITAGGDITVSTVPKAAWIVLALGIIGLTATALFGRGDTTITNSGQIGHDMTNSRIEIHR